MQPESLFEERLYAVRKRASFSVERCAVLGIHFLHDPTQSTDNSLEHGEQEYQVHVPDAGRLLDLEETKREDRARIVPSLVFKLRVPP